MKRYLWFLVTAVFFGLAVYFYPRQVKEQLPPPTSPPSNQAQTSLPAKKSLKPERPKVETPPTVSENQPEKVEAPTSPPSPPPLRALQNGVYNVQVEEWELNTGLGADEMNFGRITCQIKTIELTDERAIITARYFCKDAMSFPRGDRTYCCIPSPYNNDGSVGPYCTDDEGRKYTMISDSFQGKYINEYQNFGGSPLYIVRASQGEAIYIKYYFPPINRMIRTLYVYNMPSMKPHVVQLQ